MTEDVNRAWKDQYMLRLPDGMREQLKIEAARNGRSLNAEIVKRLQETMDLESRFRGEPAPEQNGYGTTYEEHLIASPQIGLDIHQSLRAIFGELRDLRSKVGSVRTNESGDLILETTASSGGEGADDQPFPEPTSADIVNGLKQKADALGYELVKKESGR